MIISDKQHARAVAVDYVRSMLAHGYDSHRAEQEIHASYCAPNEAGWTISHGHITVPHHGTPEYTFRFSELESEVLGPEQLSLF